MKKILILNLFLTCFFVTQAYEKRDLLQKKAGMSSLKSSLILNQKWVSYPKYTDREGWNVLTSGVKGEIIIKGETALTYEWKVVKATDYLEFDRSGSRKIMEDPFGSNNSALADLVMAELAEGKGRFMDQIANGVWFNCEMTSWSLSAHIKGAQTENTSLPSDKEYIIDLTSGDLGSFLSWTYYFLKDELDKVQPLISERLRKNLQERILDPYLNRSNFWWQAFNATPKTMVNNWNSWCNFNVLTCFMLLENDPDKLATAVLRTMVSVDQFINYNHEDGACEEEPSYWNHAAGKMYDYLQLLYTATAGNISIFDEPMIKNMGEYIAKSYVGKGWVVNFADASAKGSGESGLIFRYGKAVESMEMQQFAAYFYECNGKVNHNNSDRDLLRTLESLKYQPELELVKPATNRAASTWYAETEFCYLRNPNYHNLPKINGVAEASGTKYRSRNVKFDPSKSIFSLDLAGAYPEDASVEKWQRTYQLTPKADLIIQDEFKLKQTLKPNQLNFLTWGEPDISTSEIVMTDRHAELVSTSLNCMKP